MLIEDERIYIIITFDRPEGLIKRIKEIRDVDASCKIIISDNSSTSVYKINKKNVSVFTNIVHLNNPTTSRFDAYNNALSLKISPESIVLFRTDDDEYYEKTVKDYLDQTNDIKAPLAFAHNYMGQKQFEHSYRRPISSIIFKYKFINNFLPMPCVEGGDWILIERIFSIYSPLFIDTVIMNKVEHS